LIKNSYLPS